MNSPIKNIVVAFAGIFILLASFLFVRQDVKNLRDSAAFIGGIGTVALKPIDLNQEALANITKPGVVRIFNHVSGKAVIPDFNLNPKTLVLDFIPGSNATLPVDQYLSGSGFVVNPDGYVVTNSHVVSDLKLTLAQQIIGLAFLDLSSSPAKLLQLAQTIKEKGISVTDARQFGQELAKNLANTLVTKINFSLTRDITVLDPSSVQGKLSELIKNGFPAKVVSVNENAPNDDKDVALIKIEETNLPSLLLGDSGQVTSGNKIYVFGFPSTAQFNSGDLSEPTFTGGTVNALKDSQTKDFKVLQTDAKISPGSSGGPLFNEKGEVVGIVTFESNTAQSNGDSFAFAIPISLVQAMLDVQGIKSVQGDFEKYITSGLHYLQNSRCQLALRDFNLASGVNPKFSISTHLQSYEDQCRALIASGQSIDTSFQEFKLWVKEAGLKFWAFLGVGIIALLVIFFVFRKLMRRIKKDELEMTELESAADNRQSTSSMIQPEALSSDLLDYIKSSRIQGVTDQAIKEELKKQGWPDLEIDMGLSRQN